MSTKEIPSEAPRTREARIAALEKLGKDLDAEFKSTNSLIRLGALAGVPVPSWSMNFPTWDWFLMQCGGTPKGRIIELFGPESSGKTTIALDNIAQIQHLGGMAAFVDAEHALDPNYAEKLGVDMDNLFVHQPDNGEQALQVVDQLVRSRAVDLIVVDSVSALVPKAELEGDIGDSHVGLQARLMSQACRMLTGLCAKNGVTVIFINQIREKIGVMFGNPETTTGGRALKFFASVRVDVRKTGYLNEAGSTFTKPDEFVAVGNNIKLRFVKNKVGAPFREAHIAHFYEDGLDRYGDYISYGAQIGVVEKSGAWYSFKGERLGQGKRNAGVTVKNSPELQAAIMAEIAAAAIKPKDAK